MTHTIIIALAVFIVVLTVLSIYGVIPALRLVPDVTTFDFIRFRRISFPISAALSILAIVLFFTHGLNFGIDFRGGMLLEVQSKSGPADIAKMRSTLSSLNLGDVQLQVFGSPTDVLIRVAEQPGGTEPAVEQRDPMTAAERVVDLVRAEEAGAAQHQDLERPRDRRYRRRTRG